MFDWFPYRLTVARTDTPARPGRQARPRIRKRLALVVGLATLGATGLFSLPAAAGTAGSVTATIPIAILSLTVSPSTVIYDNCQGGNSTAHALGFPNGDCNTAGREGVLPLPTGLPPARAFIIITNSGAGGHIQVQGSDAVPQGGGPHWTLCSQIRTCSGPGITARAKNPGADQFNEITRAEPTGSPGPELANTPQCDGAFKGGFGRDCGRALAGEAAAESLQVIGPASSTSPATSFTTTVTWTVVL